MTEPSVLITVEDNIATVTLNRPARLNAFTSEMLSRLDDAVDMINADVDIAGVIVTGAGRGFCSGRDLAELRDVGEDERRRAIPNPGGHESSMLARIEVPTVAAVNGHAVGGGLGLVVQCDLVICSTEARLADGHLATGIVPSVAAWFVPRRIGPWRAMTFFVETKPLTAMQAYEIGLIDEVVKPDDLLRTARERLEPFRGVDRELLRHVKRLGTQASVSTYQAQMEMVGVLRGLERRARHG